MEVLEPLAVLHVGLAAGEVLAVAGGDQADFQARGFRVVAVGNAPQGRSHTVIVDRSNDDRTRDEIMRAIGRVEVESAPRGEGKADMTIVLGLDWREISRALEPSPGPPPEAAAPRKKAAGR